MCQVISPLIAFVFGFSLPFIIGFILFLRLAAKGELWNA